MNLEGKHILSCCPSRHLERMTFCSRENWNSWASSEHVSRRPRPDRVLLFHTGPRIPSSKNHFECQEMRQLSRVLPPVSWHHSNLYSTQSEETSFQYLGRLTPGMGLLAATSGLSQHWLTGHWYHPNTEENCLRQLMHAAKLNQKTNQFQSIYGHNES